MANSEKKKTSEKEVNPNKSIELNPDVPITNIGEETETEKYIAVLAWARMNPVTKGHQVLVDAVYDVAERVDGDPMIFLSHTQDEINNPLSYEDKIQIATEAFGGIIVDSYNRTIVDVLKEVGAAFDELYLVAGSDRVDDYQSLLDQYNSDFGFKKYTVVSAGNRDPDSSEFDGVSATKMRKAAHDGNFDLFRSLLPETIEDSAPEIYDLVRIGLGYDFVEENEPVEDPMEMDEAVLTPMQRIRRGIVMRRNKKKIEMARERMKKKFATNDALQKRARVHAIKSLRKKLAGTRGANYADLSASEKASIDTKVQKSKKAIERIAMKLLPSIRKQELSKMQKKTVNEQFEEFLNTEIVSEEVDLMNVAADTHVDNALKRKKQFHQMFTKEGKVKHDLRFKMYRNVKKKMQEDLSRIAEEIENSTNNSFEKIEAALMEKSEKTGVDFETLFEVFARGVESHDSTGKNDAVQVGFNRVNSFINEGLASQLDEDLILNEELANLMEENACAVITRAEIADLEKFADSLLDKFGIDINFTKHFGERMSDSRNNPCITVKELRDFFRKIAMDSGKKLKKAGGDVQAVLKDMQKDLNIPVVIDFMRGEFKVTLKTIMRKKNFTTPNDIIRY